MGMNGVAGGIKLEAAVTSYSTVSADVFASGSTGDLGGLIARHVPCGGTRFETDSLGVVPAVEEIVGSRSFANLRAYLNSAAVKKYGPKALEFKIIDIENDPSGLIPAKLAEYARGSKNWLDAPLWSFLFGNPTCLDASALFSTTHPFGAAGATWSNTTTSALSPATFYTGITAMASLVFENSEPAGYYPDVLMVGPDLEKMASDLCGPDRIVPIAATGLEAYSSAVAAATRTNFMANKIQVVINPRMIGTYNDYWYLIDTKREGARPIVVGDAKPFQAFSVTSPESEPMVQRSAAQFYAEGYAGLMGGVPYSIYGGLVA
jgi:hypothetical protein